VCRYSWYVIRNIALLCINDGMRYKEIKVFGTHTVTFEPCIFSEYNPYINLVKILANEQLVIWHFLTILSFHLLQGNAATKIRCGGYFLQDIFWKFISDFNATKSVQFRQQLQRLWSQIGWDVVF